MEGNSPRIEYKQIGNTGEKVSAIGLGTYGIGNYRNGQVAFEYAIERGINLIDTAQVYNTEDFVGEIVRKVGREKVFITTKLWPNNITSRDKAIRATRESLKKLGVNTVDLMLIHWPNKKMTVEQQVKNLEAVHKEGLTRYIGVSNFSVDQMEEAKNSTVSAEIVCNQVKYNLKDRTIENDILPYCEKRGVTVVAYTPIDKGKTSGTRVIKEIAQRNGRTPIQVALNYLTSRKSVIPIPKTESVDHMKEIIGSTGWKLSDNDIKLIEKT